MMSWVRESRIGPLLLILSMGVSISSCAEVWNYRQTSQEIKFPGTDIWTTATTNTENETAEFSFHVEQYRYAVNNRWNTQLDRLDDHCSRLYVVGFIEPNEPSTERIAAWLTLVAGGTKDNSCAKPDIDYCYLGPDGKYFGQMLVEQSEINTLHARLLDPVLKGEFIATCSTTYDKHGKAYGVHTEVRFTGWK